MCVKHIYNIRIKNLLAGYPLSISQLKGTQMTRSDKPHTTLTSHLAISALPRPLIFGVSYDVIHNGNRSSNKYVDTSIF